MITKRTSDSIYRRMAKPGATSPVTGFRRSNLGRSLSSLLSDQPAGTFTRKRGWAGLLSGRSLAIAGAVALATVGIIRYSSNNTTPVRFAGVEVASSRGAFEVRTLKPTVTTELPRVYASNNVASVPTLLPPVRAMSESNDSGNSTSNMPMDLFEPEQSSTASEPFWAFHRFVPLFARNPDNAQSGANVTQPSAQPAETSSNARAAEEPTREVRFAIVMEGPNRNGKIDLNLGKSVLVTTRVPVKRVSIAQPEIADINPISSTSMLVTAKTSGATQLVIWDDSENSEMVDVNVGVDVTPLRDALKARFKDVNIEVGVLNNSVSLSGRVPSLEVADQAVAMARSFSDNVMNFLEITGGTQVMLEVRFLEVSRTAVAALGVDIRGSTSKGDFTFIGPQSTPGRLSVDDRAGSLGLTANFGNFAVDAFIDALKRNNLARTLAEPNLVTMSGKPASFLAGGEFPYPVPQPGTSGGTGITIEYRQFGVRLDFTPIVKGDGKIEMRVAPEVSDLDFTNSVNISGTSVPGLRNRRVETTVELLEGQTFAIAGLLNRRVDARSQAVPGLGDLPIIGTLFRSTRFERSETELVVMVTPRIVSAMNPSQVPSLHGEKWKYPNDAELFFNGNLGGPAKDGTGATSTGATTRPTSAGKPGQSPMIRNQPATPPQYQGDYGFAPASADVEKSGSAASARTDQ